MIENGLTTGTKMWRWAQKLQERVFDLVQMQIGMYKKAIVKGGQPTIYNNCLDQILQSLNMGSSHSASNMFSYDYEDHLECPQSFWNPSTRQDLQPDQQNQATCPVLDRFISNQTITNLIYPLQPEIDSYLGDLSGSHFLITQPEDPQEPNDQDPEEQDSTNNTALNGRSSRRRNDNNNGHKKMITCLNACLQSTQKKKIMRSLKGLNIKKDSKKGSRYGFILSLLNVSYILGKDQLLKVYENFKEKIGPYIKAFKGNADTYEYLLKIMPKYLLCFQEVIKEEIEWAARVIYEIDEDFKQRRYQEKGLQATIEYQVIMETNFSSVQSQ